MSYQYAKPDQPISSRARWAEGARLMLRRRGGLLVALLLATLILLPYSVVPLARDQANWLTVASAIWHGSVPYRDFSVVNTPGLGVLYGVVNVLFGQPLLTPWILHLVAVLLCIVSGYVWAGRYYGRAGANGAAMLLALLWPITIGWWGIGQKDEVAFVLALSAAACMILGEKRRCWNALAGGLFVGAVLVKSVAVLYLLPLALQLLHSSSSPRQFLRRGLEIALGGVLMLLVPVLYFSWHDAWMDVQGSLIDRAAAYGGYLRKDVWSLLARSLAYWLICLSFAVAIPLLCWTCVRKGPPFGLMMVTAAALAVIQGRGWAYHLAPLVATGALASGVCLGQVMSEPEKKLQRILAGVLAGLAVFNSWSVFGEGWILNAQRLFGRVSAEQHEAFFSVPDMATPTESRSLGKWIRENTSKLDRIFVWGMESQVYVYADRQFVGPSFADAPIWHPQLAELRPEYYQRQRQRFYEALQQTPPALFIVARNDANPVEPWPSNKSLESLPEIMAFLEQHYETIFTTPHFIVMKRS